MNDGEEALANLIVEPRAFDLLITDNNMPRMTGVDLVRRLRDTPFHGKILVLSAHLSAENRAAYDALGVDGMIPKPFDLDQLRAVIRQIAEDTAAQAERLLSLALPESDEPEERGTK